MYEGKYSVLFFESHAERTGAKLVLLTLTGAGVNLSLVRYFYFNRQLLYVGE